jgi:hypothetical protein
VLFPIFEKLGEADKCEKRGDFQKTESLHADVRIYIEENKQLFSENAELINEVIREYGKVLFWANNENEIEGKNFLANPNMSKTEKIEIKKQLEQKLDKLLAYYKENIKDNVKFPCIFGDRQLDYSICKIKNMEYSELLKEIANIEKDNIYNVLREASDKVPATAQENAMGQMVKYDRERVGVIEK